MALAILWVLLLSSVVIMYQRLSPQDLNLPITGVAALFIVLFLKLPTPPGTFREKLARMDWMYALHRIICFWV